MFNDEVSFSFIVSLNYFGSNLGLWPGLGLYQVLELLVGLVIASKVFNRIVIILQRYK